MEHQVRQREDAMCIGAMANSGEPTGGSNRNAGLAKEASAKH